MAITKKHQEIQAKKTAIREQILAARKEANDALKKIPDTVRTGSHQVAVAYKDLAAGVLGYSPNYEGPNKATADELLAHLSNLKSTADKLCGRKPIL